MGSSANSPECARGFRGIALGVLEYLLLAREAEAHNCHMGSIRNPRKRWFQMPLVAEYRALLESTQGLDAVIGDSVVRGPSLWERRSRHVPVLVERRHHR